MGGAFSQPFGHRTLGLVPGGWRRHLGEILARVVVHDGRRVRGIQHVFCLRMGHHAPLAAGWLACGWAQCGGFGRWVPICGLVGVPTLCAFMSWS